MKTDINKLLAHWNTDEGKPYKGKLIDWKAYEENPDNIGCMCAQGQVLHLIGGLTPKKLCSLSPYEADTQVMKLLEISRAHAVLLRNINDKAQGAPAIVITNPEKVLGENALIILAFWKHLDTLDCNGWQKVEAAWAAAWAAARNAARDSSWDSSKHAGAAARDAAWNAARDSSWDSSKHAGAAAWNAAWATAGATNEIQGARVLKSNGRKLFFLRLFGFDTLEQVSKGC